MSEVRVRFAPSPTGDVHIGSMWLAQFDWLFARQNQGKFILRIEDTDRQRLVPGAVEKIYEALAWYELTPDEGPNEGGQFGPYIQSQRLDIYRHHIDQLLRQGSVYRCFCSPERLAQLRANQTAAKLPPRYDKHCLSLSVEEVQARLSRGEAHVVRLNVPTHGTIVVDDMVRGSVTFRLDQVDDSVLLKSDGFPTYHLAVVVDDHLMKISHVIRGEEWLPSTPKHLLLYQAFGWTSPVFAHLPQILGTNKKKLSKREGAAAALSFRDQGYLVAAMQNFLALMGWHPKGDEEKLSRTDVLKQFQLKHMNAAGAVFDHAKLDWLNGVYIRDLPTPELVQQLESFWHRPAGASQDKTYLSKVVNLVKDRLVKLSDIDQTINFIFPEVWDQELRSFDRTGLAGRKQTLAEATEAIQQFTTWLTTQPEPWSAPDLKTAAVAWISAQSLSNANVLWPVRVALSLRSASPDVFDLLAVLEKNESLRRLQKFGN